MQQCLICAQGLARPRTCHGSPMQLQSAPSVGSIYSLYASCCAQVKLVDAGFVWTEPHSRRLKVKLTIQKEVLNGAILQQTFVCEVREEAFASC